jgi:hypothetical protein
VPFIIEQIGYGIQPVEIIITRNKYQVTKLYGNGMSEHQRAVPENKYPEQVGKQPEYKVIY